MANWACYCCRAPEQSTIIKLGVNQPRYYTISIAGVIFGKSKNTILTVYDTPF